LGKYPIDVVESERWKNDDGTPADGFSVPLYYRLAQALCPTSEAVVPEKFQIEAKQLIQRMERHGITVISIEEFAMLEENLDGG